MSALVGVVHPDYYLPQRISVAAGFFHAYPRLGSSITDFSTSDEYRNAIYRLGIPYLAAGAVLLLAVLIANCYFFAFRDVVPGADDTHESDPHKRDCVGRSFLLFSCFLNLAIVLCIAISLHSAYTMRAAANNTHDMLIAARANVSEHVLEPARFLDELATEVAEKDVTTVSEDKQLIARKVSFLFDNRAKAFKNLLNETSQLFNNLRTIDEEVRNLSDGYFSLTVAVLLSIIGGLLLVFVCDATTPDSRCTRIISFSLLLIPLAATWAHTAVSTWMAVASGDFCESVGLYQRTVLAQTKEKAHPPVLSRANVFAKFELECPATISAAADFKQLNEFLGSSHDRDGLAGFSTGLNALVSQDISEEAWEKARFWMHDRWEFYGHCDTQILLAGKLSHHVCGNHGASAMSAMGQLWLSSCGLTLLFTVVIALLTWGHPPSEFCSGRELMYVYGAPKLISAFGDVASIRSRHSAFMKLEAGYIPRSASCGSSTDTDGLDKSDDTSSMSTERPRRNAYISHQLNGHSAKRLDWCPEVEERSSDSSRYS